MFSQPLIDRDGYGIRQVETAVKIPRHGNRVELRSVLLMDVLGQSATLAAENKIAARFKRTIPIVFLSFRGKEIDGRDFRLSATFAFQIGEVRMDGAIHLWPVIHARAFQIFVFKRERNRFHEMKRTSGTAGYPAYVPRVLRNFRSMQHDVEERVNFHG